jgi:hypothetical protein
MSTTGFALNSPLRQVEQKVVISIRPRTLLVIISHQTPTLTGLIQEVSAIY